MTDLSWTEPFHSLTIAKWSEKPGLDAVPLVMWRVTVGANGENVTAQGPTLEDALERCQGRVKYDVRLGRLLRESASADR